MGFISNAMGAILVETEDIPVETESMSIGMEALSMETEN